MAVLTDPIADMLTRIRNAALARHLDVDVPVSKLHLEIAKILHREGYIRGYQLINRGRTARLYAGKEVLPRVLGGLGIAIVSTSQGILTDREARKRGVGGEVIAEVW